ncbi:exocyst complex component SEC3 N-terminal PIP2 binding PH-domain-containing protein [Lanmaoa asiatica]|nr:exocyst complex component SEC3 N-terminal PIP2 binding PH-domain-containing protein [Lanmaoa asiatica]
MADSDRARQRIIASVFDKRNAGADVLESYVAHIKIWEDAGEGQGRKPRYILISRTTDDSGFIHKSKLNTNGSFSVGKTWKLAELRGIQVVNSVSFDITLARTYKWQTENAVDQTAFVKAIVELFRSLVGAPLHLVGVDDTSSTSNADSVPPPNEPSVPSTPPVTFLNRTPIPPDNAQDPARESVVSSASGLRPPSPSIPSHQSLVPARARATSPRPSLPSHTPTKPSLDLPRTSSPSSAYLMETHHPVHSESPASTYKPLSRNLTPKPPEISQMRREHNNRVSFFDPANQLALDRLVAGDRGSEEDAEGAEETAEETMISVEEMLEGYEWASDDTFGRKSAKGLQIWSKLVYLTSLWRWKRLAV